MFLNRLSFAVSLIGALAGAAFAPSVQAQQIYRIVGPDGRVTFSDKAPLDPTARPALASAAAATPGGANPALPFELQQAVGRYPVTLYSGASCDPCAAGRSFLAARGVPFSEKSVSSNEDIQALQRLSGGNALPFMTIGGQQLTGFSEGEWTQFLDAAGYPRTPQLPAGYRQAPATPFVSVQPPVRPVAAAAPAPARPAAAAPTSEAPAAPDNPRGIRF